MQDQKHDTRTESIRQIEDRLIELYERQSRERMAALVYVAKQFNAGVRRLEVVR